jgi:hypothetical protein
MDEQNICPLPDFAEFQTLMDNVVRALADIGREAGSVTAMAAE